MKTNQKNRFNNSRYNNRNSRVMITRNTALESSGPCGKLHGTALQLFEKYQVAAKDALIQNDLVLAQICLQHADHYMRLQNIAIMNEQTMRSNFNNNQSNNQQTSSNEKQSESQLQEEELPVIETPKEGEETSETENSTSIESNSDEEVKTSQEGEKPIRRKNGAKKLTVKTSKKQEDAPQEDLKSSTDAENKDEKDHKPIRRKLVLKVKKESQTPETNNQPSEEA